MNPQNNLKTENDGATNQPSSSRRMPLWIKIGILFCTMGLLAVAIFYHTETISHLIDRYHGLIRSNDRVSDFVNAFGPFAPLIFILLQILQVIIAPVPGEASGFIGGYIFGAPLGFVYSTLGLTIGSLINILIGRLLGKKVVRRIISRKRLENFDRILKRQGVIVFFILFIIPGFPKDYLCIFLGLSKVPLKVLILMAGVGRIPGTLLLSIQGAYLFEKNYIVFLSVLAFSLVIGMVSFHYKESIYRWVESFNGK